MKLADLRASALTIPFKTTFRHASAKRAATQTFWVEAEAEGARGYGEGCPREYVTAESLQSAATFFFAHRAQWRDALQDVSALRAWCDGNAAAIDRNPAAWCAVESALLDLIGTVGECSVESLLGLPDLEGTFRYTAVVGDEPPPQFAAQLERYAGAGFQDFKIKLSGNTARDLSKVRALESAGLRGASVRADANNLWENAETAIRHLEALQFGFRAIEEPVRAGDYAGMSRIGEALDAPIILDESVLRAAQLDLVSARPERWIINLRISKMGGLLRSLDMVQELRRRRMALVIGAQVGETSVLTRAALTVAATARDILVAQEGAFGTHLLARDVVDPPIMFGRGGHLDAASLRLRGGGFGLAVDLERSDVTWHWP